jgi:uncharacterized protein
VVAPRAVAPTLPRLPAIPSERPAIRAAGSGCCEVVVRLLPGARTEEILGERGGALRVRVTAPALEGRANEALCRLIAKRARIGVRRVSIARGARAREKLVRVEGVGVGELRSALAAGPASQRRR